MAKTDFLAPPDLRIVGSRSTISGEARFSLAAMKVDRLPDGALVFVQSVKAYFQLDKASTDTADGISIIAAFGGGRWYRKSAEFAGSSPWLSQDIWYIDADNGSDENNGSTAATALASHAELERRLGHDPLVTSFITINILSDLDEILHLRARLAGSTGSILYQGTPVATNASDTLGATNVPFAVNAEGQIEGTTIVDFTPYIGKQVRFTSGAQSGWATWITAIATTAVGNEIARVGYSAAFTAALPPNINNANVQAAIGAPGDTFDIVTLPRVYGLDIHVFREDAPSDGYGSSDDMICFADIAFAAPNVTIMKVETGVRRANSARAHLFRCLIDNGLMLCDGLTVKGCGFADYSGGGVGSAAWYSTYLQMSGCSGGSAVFSDCAFGPGHTSISKCYFDGLVKFVGGCRMRHDPGDTIDGPEFAVWCTTTTYAIAVDEGSTVYFHNVWGAQAGAGDGFVVNGRAYYSAGGTVANLATGAGNDINVGGVGGAYGTLPTITAANNAMFVQAV
jgi:hypothetical protein